MFSISPGTSLAFFYETALTPERTAGGGWITRQPAVNRVWPRRFPTGTDYFF